MRRYTIHVDSKGFEVSLIERSQSRVEFLCNGQRYSVTVTPTISQQSTQSSSPISVMPSPRPITRASSAKPGEVVTPMPGIVVNIPVAIGQEVRAGETVAVVEAMKMENNIQSPVHGVVASIEAVAGTEVGLGQVLLKISSKNG